MTYPKILINTEKIKNNVSTLVNLCEEYNLSVSGVTKAFSAHNDIVEAYVQGGVKYLADSRVENLEKLKDFNLPKIMLRLPMISEVDSVVEFADISLNSEIETIKALSKAAIEKNKVHKIILMMDLGDLREGFFNEDELYQGVEEILKLTGVELIGIGTNLTCYGGVVPSKEIFQRLASIKEKINENYNIELEIVSGGNSSTIHLLGKEELLGINNLRLGEVLLLGRETAYGNPVQGTHSDAFELEVEIIELKEKPSIPTGKIGRDAFGNVPSFVDRGVRKRAICGIGKQDTDFDTIHPKDKDIIILGASSDHLILDVSDSKKDYKVGDTIKFSIEYLSLLRAMTSEYITKEISN